MGSAWYIEFLGNPSECQYFDGQKREVCPYNGKGHPYQGANFGTNNGLLSWINDF